MIHQTETISFIHQLHRNESGAVVLLDVRSPKEFAQGHIPGAVNFPLLNDEERHVVGITYKESGQQDAVKKGFELVGHKFADFISQAESLSHDRKIHLYCWRGGLRSNIMAWILGVAGFEVTLLKGGYKSYRGLCYDLFEKRGKFVVLTGMTGTGKTDWLNLLADEKEQVIDLEKIAHHKGSAFGGLGQPEQHNQEQFENLLGMSLFHKADNSIWLEDESRFIGRLRIPDVFFLRMMNAPHVELRLSEEQRINRIIREYGIFPPEALAEKTKAVIKRMGGDQVKISLEALDNGDLAGWIRPLLMYYDKSYQHGKTRFAVNTVLSIDLEIEKHEEVIRILKTVSAPNQTSTNVID